MSKRRRRGYRGHAPRCPGCGAKVAQRGEFCNAACVLLWDSKPDRVFSSIDADFRPPARKKP